MEIALLVLDTAGRLRKTAAQLFSAFDLSPAQFNVLHLLSDQPDGLRAGDLAMGLVVDPSNITGLLSRMEKEGLVRTERSKVDRRSRVVRLATKGRTRWQKAHVAYAAALAQFEAALTPAERAVMAKGLTTLSEKCHGPLA